MAESQTEVDPVVKEMLVRLGTLSGMMEAMAEAMFSLNVFDEWAEVLQKEAKKTDELVEIWSSM